jgi:hypothetical protein
VSIPHFIWPHLARVRRSEVELVLTVPALPIGCVEKGGIMGCSELFLIESRGTSLALSQPSHNTPLLQHAISRGICTSSHVAQRQPSILLYPTKTNSAALMIKICALITHQKCGDFISNSLFARATMCAFLFGTAMCLNTSPNHTTTPWHRGPKPFSQALARFHACTHSPHFTPTRI